jgi:hypothetical protein
MRQMHRTGARETAAAEPHELLPLRADGLRLPLLVAVILVLCYGLESPVAAQGPPGIHSQHGAVSAPSGTGIQPGQPQAPGHPVLVVPGAQPSQSLSVPQVWHPTVAQPLPPAPPALVVPVVPASYLGCWKGQPGGYDSFTWLTSNPMLYNVGSPGEMVVCFRNNTAEVVHATVYISPAKRALDISLQLGLSYTTFDAHSIHTDIYSITPKQMHLRFQLSVEAKAHLLFLFPIHMLDEPVVEDVIATPLGPDAALVEAREVLYFQGEPAHSATWHAYFSRVADEEAH